MKELLNIQQALRAPKSQVNNFGRYTYRSAEDILEAVKPHLKANGCTLTISDDLVMVGTRIYVKAIATLTNDKGESATTTAFAREEESKKGMDASQVTGAASSYARKYALGGLLAIDDNRDSDATNVGATTPEALQSQEERLAEAMSLIETADSRLKLTAIWNMYADLQGLPKFADAVKEKCQKYPKQ